MNDSRELYRRRHPEWHEHHRRWCWILDSLEGGERYRDAIYGHDSRGLPIRNLLRHKREYPDPRDRFAAMELAGAGPAGSASYQATDDDYELRRARTPAPTFLAEAVDTHLARVYAREVARTGPKRLEQWWADIDTQGTTIDHWMAEIVAPLLLALGQLDLYVDHPCSFEASTISTRADLSWLGLDRAIARVILPQHMLWWRLDESGAYEECLVQEQVDGPDGLVVRFRYWNKSESVLHDADGNELARTPHPFRRVPITRVFDRRKPRCGHTGQSRYEGVAERQREYYNRDSELILSDTTQAHPLLQGPEDYVQADGTIPIGPSWLLPKKRNSQGTTVTYEGFDVVGFPKDGADSIRLNKADLREEVDRDCSLVRPTGRAATYQSGLAKMLDHCDGNNRLGKIARVLARAERALAELALDVLDDGQGNPADRAAIQVLYPTDFDLFTAGEVAAAAAEFQALVARAGALPLTESLLLSRLVRLCLPGLSDAQYAHCDGEIAAYLKDQAQRRRSQPDDVGGPGPEQTVYAEVHKWS